MSYKNFQRDRWNSLARQFDPAKPLRSVISAENDQTNYYFDKVTKRMLDRSLRFEHKRVLDLGCGIGRVSVWLASRAQHVTAVDISEDIIRLARNAAASHGLHNIAFGVYDGTTLPFSDGSFDVVVCLGVLKYVIDEGDFSRVIGEMCRTVVAGGQVAVIDQFDYTGPVELHGAQDIGGLSVLRRPLDYISLFQENGLGLIDQCSIYRRRFHQLAGTALAKLPLGRFIAASPLVTRAVAKVDIRIDELLRHRVRPVRGFQLLSFVRLS